MSVGLKWIFENTVNYETTINEDHNLNVLVGTSAEKSGIGESLSVRMSIPYLMILNMAIWIIRELSIPTRLHYTEVPGDRAGCCLSSAESNMIIRKNIWLRW